MTDEQTKPARKSLPKSFLNAGRRMNEEQKATFLLIPEFSWWQSADGRRLFCVVEKHCKGVGPTYRPVRLGLIERGIMEKTYVDYDKFAQQVTDKKLTMVGLND